MITSAKANRRTSSAPVSAGNGSWKITGPAAIVRMLAVALVIAITGTAGPSWSDLADTSRPTSDQIRITNANGGVITSTPMSVRVVIALIVMSEPAPSRPAETARGGPPAPLRAARTNAPSVVTIITPIKTAGS